MERRIIREDEVDTTEEVAKMFQRVFDNQYLLEAKIEQLEKSKKGKSKKGSVTMKTLTSLVLIAMLVTVCFGVVNVREINSDTVPIGQGRFPQDLRKWVSTLNQDISDAGTEKGTGQVFYVDSNVTNAGVGTTMASAVATLNEAVALCEDNRGDIIYVAQGHAETFIAVDSADLDVIGITVIGLGTGSDRPIFTYTTGTAGELVIAAANVTIRGLVFQPGIANVVHAIEVEADADGSIIEFCEFLSGTTDAFEFVDAIQVATAADDLIIRYNKATETTAGAVSWLDVTAGIVDNLSVYGNEIYGDYSEAVVSASTRVHTVGYYGFNVITNLNAVDLCFDFQGAATGVLEFNRMFAAAEATVIDPGSLSCFENLVTTDTDLSGMPVPVHDDGLTQLNATTITAISSAVDGLAGIGMIGLVETNTGGSAEVISAALGGFGNDAFLEGWSLMCIFDTAGAVGTAPSGQIRDITDYVSTGGTFTVDTGFAASLTAGDFVLLTPTHLIPKDFGPLRPKTIYCDDGGSGGEATNWQNALTTLEAAEAIANPGDTILIGENHNQAMNAAMVIDVAGVTVIGMGEGDIRPSFDYDSAATELTLNAAGITIKNIRLIPSASETVAAIVVGASGLGCTIDNVAFEVGEAADDEFIDGIVPNAAAEGLTVKNCTSWNTNATAGAQDTFVNLEAVTLDDCTIIDNIAFGTFAKAPIYSGAAVPVNVNIHRNTLTNLDTGDLCIELAAGSTGVISYNIMFADTFGSALQPGSASCSENYATNAINTSAHLVPSIDDEIAEIGPGRIFYVDSGTPGAGDGRAWDTAVATLDAGVNLCTDDRGDTIYVASGHTEAVTTSFADLDLGGITVIGLGNGKLRPFFDYTGGSGSMLINNDDITVRNLWFHANVDSVLIAVTVQTGSENVTIEDCIFTTESATDEFDVSIDHAAGNHRAIVRNCNFQMGAGDAVSAVHFIDSDYAIIEDNITAGDYSTACLHNETTASDHILVRNNELFNGTIGGDENSEPGIEFKADTSGMIVNNNIVSILGTAELSIVAADCYLFGNHYNSVESSSAGRGIGLEIGKTYHVVVTGATIGDQTLFTVTGGPILITNIVGEVTTVLPATAARLSISIDATSGLDYVFSTSVDVQSAVDGGRIIFTNANPAVLTPLALAGTGSSSLMSPWYCVPGLILLVDADDNGDTGNIDWHMTFTPLADGVTVTPQ